MNSCAYFPCSLYSVEENQYKRSARNAVEHLWPALYMQANRPGIVCLLACCYWPMPCVLFSMTELFVS